MHLIIANQGLVYDFLIKGRTLYDGSGSPGIAGDLAISVWAHLPNKSGRICRIDGRIGEPAHKIIDFTFRSIPKLKARSARASRPKSSVTAAFPSHLCSLAKRIFSRTI